MLNFLPIAPPIKLNAEPTPAPNPAAIAFSSAVPSVLIALSNAACPAGDASKRDAVIPPGTASIARPTAAAGRAIRSACSNRWIGLAIDVAFLAACAPLPTAPNAPSGLSNNPVANSVPSALAGYSLSNARCCCRMFASSSPYVCSVNGALAAASNCCDNPKVGPAAADRKNPVATSPPVNSGADTVGIASTTAGAETAWLACANSAANCSSFIYRTPKNCNNACTSALSCCVQLASPFDINVSSRRVCMSICPAFVGS